MTKSTKHPLYRGFHAIMSWAISTLKWRLLYDTRGSVIICNKMYKMKCWAKPRTGQKYTLVLNARYT